MRMYSLRVATYRMEVVGGKLERGNGALVSPPVPVATLILALSVLVSCLRFGSIPESDVALLITDEDLREHGRVSIAEGTLKRKRRDGPNPSWCQDDS